MGDIRSGTSVHPPMILPHHLRLHAATEQCTIVPGAPGTNR